MSNIPAPSEKGVADAKHEIASGEPRYFAGTRGKWGDFMVELFDDRFSVQVVHTHCFVDPDLTAYRKGYNSTVEAYIDLKFGVGAFAQAGAGLRSLEVNFTPVGECKKLKIEHDRD